jgi:hypothetical protein
MYVFCDINPQNLPNPPNPPNPCKPVQTPTPTLQNPYPWPGVRVWRVGVGVQLKYPRVTRDNLYRKHARICWGAETVAAADETRNVDAAREAQ